MIEARKSATRCKLVLFSRSLGCGDKLLTCTQITVWYDEHFSKDIELQPNEIERKKLLKQEHLSAHVMAPLTAWAE
jgi:hypothetical protein